MIQYIDKTALAALIEKRLSLIENGTGDSEVMKRVEGVIKGYKSILSFLDTLEVKESDETAKAFAKIIRANLTGIDKDVQYKFEQLYKEITGKKMYQGYSD